MLPLRLGVNIDHVATLRNARGGHHPCPVRAALFAAESGADGITAHLREDRRHIRDEDIERLRREVDVPLNLEMAATADMQAIALRILPHAVCLVPEKRNELTTEGGLDVAGNIEYLKSFIAPLAAAGIRVSLFIDAEESQIKASAETGAAVVELHTGAYAHAEDAARTRELARLQRSATLATELDLECHAGHGLNFENVSAVSAILELHELNIGHFLIGEAMFIGLKFCIQEMRSIMDAARKRG